MPHRSARAPDRPLVEGMRGIAVLTLLTLCLAGLAYLVAATFAVLVR